MRFQQENEPPLNTLRRRPKASHHRGEVSISPEEARPLSSGVSADKSTSCSSRQIYQDGEEVKDEFIPAWVFQYPLPSYLPNSLVHPPHPQLHQQTYPLDDAGARSTSDMFHVLQASDVVNTLFSKVAKLSNWESVEVLGVEIRVVEAPKKAPRTGAFLGA